MIITFVAFFSIFIAVVFHLAARQKPIFFIRKEGLERRVIGTPIHSVKFGKFGFLFLPFELYWQLLSRRIIQTQIVRLPWEEINDIVYQYGILSITGSIVEGKALWDKKNPFSFGAAAFGVSTKSVEASLRYYRDNISDRESLPGWDHTGEVFEIVY